MMRMLLLLLLVAALVLMVGLISLARNPLRRRYLMATLKELPHLIPRYFA